MKRDRTCPACGPQTPLIYLHQRTILGNRYVYHCHKCDTNWTLPFKGDAAKVIAKQRTEIAALKRQVKAGEQLVAALTKHPPLYTIVEVPSDIPVQYVGVYVLKWGKVSEPERGFRPVDEFQEADYAEDWPELHRALAAWDAAREGQNAK